MFEMMLRVGPSDIDELGHLNNVRYVQWVQDVAVAHSASVGLDWAAYAAMRGVFVLRRHEADYLRSILVDAELRARTWLGNKRGVQVDRYIEFFEGELLVFKSMTRWVYIDLDAQRPARIPKAVFEAFESSFATPPEYSASELGPAGRQRATQ
jgi:acyl-CoA thioester hydrolase